MAAWPSEDPHPYTLPSAMRRRLITGFLLLDGLCAVLAPVAATALADGPMPTAYLEVGGVCVEQDQSDPELLAGKVVPMAHCTDA